MNRTVCGLLLVRKKNEESFLHGALSTRYGATLLERVRARSQPGAKVTRIECLREKVPWGLYVKVHSESSFSVEKRMVALRS